MKDNFDRALAEILRHEGGYVNDPHDPGGETNMGISKRSYPLEDIKNMTRERAAVIYRRDFWNAVRADELPDGVDLAAFDAAVNSGPSRSAKWLQRAVAVRADGVVGPNTLAAVGKADPARTINRMLDDRLAWLHGLPTWERYRIGWSRRIGEVRSVGLDMAEAAQSPAEPPVDPVAAWWASAPPGAVEWLRRAP